MVDEERVIVRRRSIESTPASDRSVTWESIRWNPSGAELARRLTVLVFGVAQMMIALRIALALVGANEDNGLVGFVYAVADPLVAPFEGILGTDRIRDDGALLDVAAGVALVGWTLIEVLILGAIGLARREP